MSLTQLTQHPLAEKHPRQSEIQLASRYSLKTFQYESDFLIFLVSMSNNYLIGSKHEEILYAKRQCIHDKTIGKLYL